MGITLEQISRLHPKLFHMAEQGAWPGIQQHGLLSTSALLDLFEVAGEERAEIEECRRPGPKIIKHPKFGTAVIRDQRPMSDSKLRGCLDDGLTPPDWYRLLNGRVFFWLTQKRLVGLMKAYRERPHLVLEVDTAELLRRHGNNVLLTPMNTGTTSPMAFPRGIRTFLPPDQYPFEENARKKGGRTKAIVELTVGYAVRDIADFTLSATHREVSGEDLTLIDTLHSK